MKSDQIKPDSKSDTSTPSESSGTWMDHIKDKNKSKLEISKRFQNMWRSQQKLVKSDQIKPDSVW